MQHENRDLKFGCLNLFHGLSKTATELIGESVAQQTQAYQAAASVVSSTLDVLLSSKARQSADQQAAGGEPVPAEPIMEPRHFVAQLDGGPV